MNAMEGAGLNFLLGKLDSLLSQEINLLSEAGRGVAEIRRELAVIQAWLEAVEATPSALYPPVKAWVKQVRDVAHGIEDCVDGFELLVGAPPSERRAASRVGSLLRTIHTLSTLRERHRIATQVRELLARALEVSERVSRYVSAVSHGVSSSARTPADPMRDPRLGAHFIQEAELVGIGGPKWELLQLLSERRPQLGVVAVVGMGGLGKTTLVKRLYESDELRRDFDCFAWVTVSQSFATRELLTKMARELSIDATVEEEVDPRRLVDKISRLLGQKRYVVVLDDIWGVDAWEVVRHALPDNQMGSRVMLTTRIERVAAFCSQNFGYVYRLRPLPLEEARVLFHRKAFRSSNPENPNPPCPPGLVEVADSILKRCGGLPLAVVTIGGLLATKNNDVQEWRKLDQTLGLELESNPCLENIKIILNLSFSDLPSHLKACFLYLSIYPEDYQIKGTQLVRLWVAEGFVRGRLSRRTLEEVAEDYLGDLVDRSMIQVTEVHPAGRVRRCQVHDLVREILVSKAMEENFATLLHEHNSVVPPPPESLRRLSIHGDCPGRENTMEGMSFSRLRSLISFRKPDIPLAQSCQGFVPSMRLLRVLDVGCNTLCHEFLCGIPQLFHLRYLRLRGRYIGKIPKSLGKLQKLEVLDLKGNNLKLPREVTKLPRLRHLLVNNVGLPRGIGRLKALQKLKKVDAQRSSTSVMRELSNLSQLRSLSVYNLRMEDGFALCSSTEKMTCLRSLKVYKVDPSVDWRPLNLNCTCPVLQELQCLALGGKLQIWPSWIASCEKLAKVVLERSELTDDPFICLQTLPNLQELHLLAMAYSGECLHSGSDGFFKLKVLRIKELGRLELVKIDEGAMPSLEKLSIEECGRLRALPLGIERLAMLKELNLYRVSGEFQLQDEDRQRVQHVGHFTVVRSGV